MAEETGPIRVFVENGEWLVDYGSYAKGYYATRGEAVVAAEEAGVAEARVVVIEPDVGLDTDIVKPG